MNKLFQAQQDLKRELKKIPKENKLKFSCDLYKLVQIAQKDNYDNFDFSE